MKYMPRKSHRQKLKPVPGQPAHRLDTTVASSTNDDAVRQVRELLRTMDMAAYHNSVLTKIRHDADANALVMAKSRAQAHVLIYD